ncbi:MAG TPA: molybdenum cofactor guanylyltransferase [Terriglobales bacterium]|nr:molybdenum cofactor guanylyltransferase [Terriglobales bacterium]
MASSCKLKSSSRPRLYHLHVTAISAFILAGGKSSRMGADKAFLEFGGRTLLARALELATTAAESVAIVGDPAKFAEFAPAIADIFPVHGPLAGIHAALLRSETELNLMLAVDLPFLDDRLLKYVVAQAECSSALVAVPFVSGHYQPLCAVYRKAFASLAEEALAQGRNKIDALFPGIPVRVIDEKELANAGCNPAALRNVNTPEEWEQTKRELESRAHHL